MTTLTYGQPLTYGQLTFDVGGQRPTSARVRLTGTIAIHRQLEKGDELVLHLLDETGEIVLDAPARVVGVAVLDEDRKDETVTVREHKVKLDA